MGKSNSTLTDRLILPLIVAVLGGVIVWWLTTVVLPGSASKQIDLNNEALTCQQIERDFPQTLDAVKAKFGLPSSWDNFRLVYENCGSIANGFIFEGTVEFSIQTSPGGCIDSYSGAYFSDKPTSTSFGGLRVYNGTVRATGVTYRVAWCEKTR